MPLEREGGAVMGTPRPGDPCSSAYTRASQTSLCHLHKVYQASTICTTAYLILVFKLTFETFILNFDKENLQNDP